MFMDMLTIAMHAGTLGIFLYTILIALVLLPFGIEMHDQIMKNTTTNENLRKKWNAKQTVEVNEMISDKEKRNHFYFSKLPQSKIQRYFDLRKIAD